MKESSDERPLWAQLCGVALLLAGSLSLFAALVTASLWWMLPTAICAIAWDWIARAAERVKREGGE